MQFDAQAVKHSFGKAAASYDEHALLQNHVRAQLVRLAKQHFPQQAYILDNGCGTGAFARENAQAKWRITQMDVAHAMCREATKHKPAVQANAQQLPYKDGAFDAIFSSLMMQWLNAPQEAWAEMARILTPGGYVAVSTLAAGTLVELKEAFSVIDSRPHVSEFQEVHDIMAQANAAGLSLVEAKQIPVVEYYAHTIAVMRALQMIGATNKQQSRRKGLMTPSQFARVEEAYERRYRRMRGLQVTWQPLYLVLRKA